MNHEKVKSLRLSQKTHDRLIWLRQNPARWVTVDLLKDKKSLTLSEVIEIASYQIEAAVRDKSQE